MEFKHIPVMLKECIDNLNIKPNGVYVDCTLGGGGHSSLIASRLDKDGTLICFDLDDEAISYASQHIQCHGKVHYVHSNFKNIVSELQKLGIYQVDGILADFGVSSYQIDNAERGFSYMQDGPLNMAMNRNAERTAEYIVNNYSEQNLVDIFSKYGEEKYSKRIANAIVDKRKQEYISSTKQLVKIIEESVPTKARYEAGHPAKRVFQALRIEVNQELAGLDVFLYDCVRKLLSINGRLVIITFHSLEDRIVKDAFKLMCSDCICDKKIPICVCNHHPEVMLVNKKPILPTDEELQNNSRSHSAKVRVVQKL